MNANGNGPRKGMLIHRAQMDSDGGVAGWKAGERGSFQHQGNETYQGGAIDWPVGRRHDGPHGGKGGRSENMGCMVRTPFFINFFLRQPEIA